MNQERLAELARCISQAKYFLKEEEPMQAYAQIDEADEILKEELEEHIGRETEATRLTDIFGRGEI